MCAFDFSPYAIEALTAAAALTRATGTELRVVHVYDQLGAEVDHEARAAQLGALRAELRRLGLHPDAGRVVTGATAEAIVGQCGAQNTRLLVVGAHGAGRARLLGSVAAAIATRSAVPVLVVRNAAVLCDMAARKSELAIDVAFGSDESSAAALRWANAFAAQFPAIVRPLRAANLGEVPAPGVQYLSGGGSLAENVAVRAARDRAGLIVVGRSERRGLARLRRPTVRATLQNSTTNVVCVPASFAAESVL